MNSIDIEKMKEKSIVDKNRLKKAYQKGQAKGLKQGFVRGAFLGFLAAATITMGYQGIEAITHKYPTNISYKTATVSYNENSHPCSDPRDYWVDFFKVADEFDPETMDLDSYIYGVYCGLNNVDSETRLADMNEFVNRLFLSNKTEYSSFVLYCQSRGLVDMVEGNAKVNEEKYRKAMKDYMNEYRSQLEHENKLQEFKEGRSK